MNIGFVSVWAERGAGYVTKAYLNILEKNNSVFVYARAGEIIKPTPEWNQEYVTWGKILPDTRISWNHFRKWIEKNKLEIIFFNEQRDFRILYQCKLFYPDVKLGTYIDYYKLDMVPSFKMYDFLICNTKRHQSVFSWHSQAYYIPWGTDIDLYTPANDTFNLVNENVVTFFHSAGMATRKGTDTLLNVFLNTDLWKKSRLVLHTQRSLSSFTTLSKEELKEQNVEVIEKTVKAPGLYYMGDVYVYPTTLDGLGLTMYEALSSGLPVITSNNAPMNEIVDDSVGALIAIEKYLSREDGYYWPLCYVDKADLYEKMNSFAENPIEVCAMKKAARLKAEERLDFSSRKKEIEKVFYDSKIIERNPEELKAYLKRDNKKKKSAARVEAEKVLPVWMVDGANRMAKFIKGGY
ncbi:MAG: glycosyltransferase family 4 protein [Eisenbergiella sp.]